MRIQNLHDALAYFPDQDGHWTASDLPATEDRLRTALITSVDRPVGLLASLARVQALQGNLNEARVTLDEAQTKLDAAQGPVAYVQWLLEQGRYLCLSRSPARAHDLFAQAWTKAHEINQPSLAIDAALMLSTVRPPKFQNEWLKKALDLAEGSADPQARNWLAQLLFLDGWHAFDFRQFETALASFDRALAQPMISEDESRGFAIRWSKGRTLRAVGQIAEALAIQENLLERMQSRGRVNGHVFLEIAECKQVMKQTESAKTFFELAYADLSADGWYSDNKADELERMKYLYKKR